MSQDHASLLKKLEKEAREKQVSFIDNVAQRLGRERLNAEPQHAAPGAPDFWQAYELPLEHRIELFMANWQQAGGHARRLNDWSEVQDELLHLTRESGAKTLLRHDDSALQNLGLEQALPTVQISVWDGRREREALIDTAARADIGLIIADAAVATTGSLLVMSSSRKGRAVSLLPPILIALIPIDRLKTRLGEVMADIRKLHTDTGTLPAGIHFVSGPSRSADIENDLTIGVHGPGVVYAFIVGSEK